MLSETCSISDHRVRGLAVSKLHCTENTDLRQAHPASWDMYHHLRIQMKISLSTWSRSHFASEIPVENAPCAQSPQIMPQSSSWMNWWTEYWLPPSPDPHTCKYKLRESHRTKLWSPLGTYSVFTRICLSPRLGWMGDDMQVMCWVLRAVPTEYVHTCSVHTASTLMTVHRNFGECGCRLISRVSS